MDETIRIYNPKENFLVASLPKRPYEIEEAPKPRYEKESRYKTLRGILDEQNRQEKELSAKYPAFNVFYNWATLIIIAVLLCSFISWGVQVSNDKKVSSLVAIAMADYQAEQQAVEDEKAAALLAEQQSEEFVERKMAESLGLLYQGADKFRDKYGYGEEDFKTYGRCVFNRVENPAYPSDIFEVINQPNQWVGYSANSPLINEYYEMALRHIHEWRHETTKPCSNDYLWAELTPNGIYLKNDFHADGYAIRWQAK